MRRLFTAGLGVIGLAATTISLGPIAATAAPRSPASTITWSTCTDDEFLQSIGAQCGTLTVPLDYAHPNAGTIQLALSRLQHTSSNFQGIMLVNPGGPGGSGRELSFLKLLIPNGGGDGYDWIGFDPRGVGSSVPALTCDPNYFAPTRPPYVPRTPAIETAWLTRSHDYANQCAASSAAAAGLLSHVHTTDNARDMDSIRKALGQQVLNYYGFSYGTYLGQVYATMFPNRVGRFVLDSNVDPRRVFYQSNLDQDVAFETDFRLWFQWIAEYDNVYHLGSTERAVSREYYSTLRALTKHPDDGLGAAEFNDTFGPVGYAQANWPFGADLLSGYINGGATAQDLLGIYDGVEGVGNDNNYAMYLGTECTDAPWPTNWAKWRRDNWRLYFAGNRFLTWENAWFNAPCAFWPVGGTSPVNVTGKHISSGPLLIDETLDGATPFEGSLEVRKLFPSSSLLAEPGGTTHAGSLSGNACVDDTIAAYLSSGVLPARTHGKGPDKICAPLPLPVPTELATSSAAARASRSATGVSLTALRARLADVLARSYSAG